MTLRDEHGRFTRQTANVIPTDDNIVSCPYCDEPLDLNDAYVAHSVVMDAPCHLDCLFDSGEATR